jgi:predicted naringenin-chalcone synthase
MSFITAIGTAVPPNRFKQDVIAEFMTKAMLLDYAASRKLKTIFRASGISYRHSVLTDFGKSKDFTFFPNSVDFEPFPSTKKRVEEFRAHAIELSKSAIRNCLAKRPDFQWESVTHLIVVSCTGMYAPGLDIELVKVLGLRPNVQRTAINFMGCYAAFNAIKAGDAFCKADKKSKVLIVCAEMCSLHFQKDVTDDNLLANGLFADGAAAVLMEAVQSKGWNLSLTAFHNALSFTDEEHMAWTIGDSGFEMKLSSYVPDVIQGGIKKLTMEMLTAINKKIDSIKHFAIHPGGKKILEVVEKELGISRDQNYSAYHVLNNFGNMSSPTVLFVLDQLMKGFTPEDNQSLALSIAFGPGLTLESILYTVHYT